MKSNLQYFASKKNELSAPWKALVNFIILFLLQGPLVMAKLAVRAFFAKSSPIHQPSALISVTIVRYHCGGWSEEVNSCILFLSYMVYL